MCGKDLIKMILHNATKLIFKMTFQPPFNLFSFFSYLFTFISLICLGIIYLFYFILLFCMFFYIITNLLLMKRHLLSISSYFPFYNVSFFPFNLLSTSFQPPFNPILSR